LIRLLLFAPILLLGILIDSCSMPAQTEYEAPPEHDPLVNPFGPVGALSDGGTVFVLAAGDEADQAVLERCREILQDRLLLGIPASDMRVILRDGSIIVAIPYGPDLEAVAGSLQRTGLLEIIDSQGEFLPLGTTVRTSNDSPDGTTDSGPIYSVVVSGSDISVAYLTTGNLGDIAAGFTLSPDGADRFYDFTSTHIGEPMAIVVDKVVISSPQINAAISGSVQIVGVNSDEAGNLVVLLKSGVLPTPLSIVKVANLLPVQVEGATILARPSTSALIEDRLEQGTLVYVTGQPTVGDDGQQWLPVAVLETGATGYVPAANLRSEQ